MSGHFWNANYQFSWIGVSGVEIKHRKKLMRLESIWCWEIVLIPNFFKIKVCSVVVYARIFSGFDVSNVNFIFSKGVGKFCQHITPDRWSKDIHHLENLYSPATLCLGGFLYFGCVFESHEWGCDLWCSDLIKSTWWKTSSEYLQDQQTVYVDQVFFTTRFDG